RDFALFWLAALAAGLATQMTAVAVGWQVYAIHRHAFDLGLIGLLEFAPLPLLALPAGQLADRFPRKLLFAASILLTGAVAAGLLTIRERAVESVEGVAGPATVGHLLGGLHLIRDTPVLLGAITLDLFAVLFGGAVALLPLFARSILHTGPAGLGLLRSAPAVGALLAGVVIAHRPVRAKSGRALLIAVAVFGASMIVFGLSKWFALSAVALALSGGADM